MTATVLERPDVLDPRTPIRVESDFIPDIFYTVMHDGDFASSFVLEEMEYAARHGNKEAGWIPPPTIIELEQVKPLFKPESKGENFFDEATITASIVDAQFWPDSDEEEEEEEKVKLRTRVWNRIKTFLRKSVESWRFEKGDTT